MFGPDDYVFGNAIGARVGSVNTSSQATCRRAGIEDLNFHDLRREAGSRLLEGGMPEHYVQRFLDHANLSTTSRYLATTRRGMHQVFRQYEEHQAEKTVKSCKFVASSDESAPKNANTPRATEPEKSLHDRTLQ